MSFPGFAAVLDTCLAITRGENVVLLVDSSTETAVVDRLAAGISDRGAHPQVVETPVPELPGSEPSAAAAEALLRADAAVELTGLFIGSSHARQTASAAGCRYLAMPGVVLGTFREQGPLDVDFHAISEKASAIGQAWESGDRFRLTSIGGTHLEGVITGRPGRVLDGIATDRGDYMAPPDIEAGTAPVEGTASGQVVVDADLLFMGQGPLDEPVIMHIEEGRLVGVEGRHGDRLLDMIERCDDPLMSNLAEVSMGLNPLGTVCGVPMETESALGTAHIALGNSIAYGGTVDARAHLDCVMTEATLEIDGKVVISNGSLG